MMLHNIPKPLIQPLEIRIKEENETIYNNCTMAQTQGNKSNMNNFGLSNGQSENIEIIIMPQNEMSKDSKSNAIHTLMPLKERMWSLINTMKDFCLSLLGSLKEEAVIQQFWSEFYVLKSELLKVKELFDQDQKESIIGKHPHDAESTTNQPDIPPEVRVLNRSFNFFQENTFVATLKNNPENSKLQIEKKLNEQKILPIQGSLNGNINTSISSLVFVPSGPSTTVNQNVQLNITGTTITPINRKAPVLKRKTAPKRKLKIKTNLLCKKRCETEETTVEPNDIAKKLPNKKTTKNENIESKAAGNELPNYDRDETGKRILKWATKEEAEHYQTFRVPHPEWEFAYKCNLCESVYRKWYQLRRHDLGAHTRTVLRQCTICKKRTTGMTVHMLIHKNERNFSCDNCGASFIQAAHLRTHVAQITACRFPSFQCKICEEKFHKEKEYGNHFKEKHLKKNIICDLCGEEVCEKCVKDKHQVTLLKLYKCKFCEESFTFQREYKKHIKQKHMLEISKIWLKCSDCLKYFPYHDALQRHRQKCHEPSHSQVLCEYCPLTFFNTTLLKTHIINKHFND